MHTRLLVSVSGIAEVSMDDLAGIAGELDGREVAVSWLAGPRTVGRTPALAEWIKDRARCGDSVLMHGYDHSIGPSHRPVWPGRRAEFAALPAHEAGLRLTAAVATLERAGLRVDGFAPPRWLGSDGTRRALRGHRIALYADAAGVHELRTGEYWAARVHSLGPLGARSEPLRYFAMVRGVVRAARRTGLVRLSMDAADLVHPDRRAALLAALELALAAGARPSTYGALRGAGTQVLSASPPPSTRTSVPSGARLVNSP